MEDTTIMGQRNLWGIVQLVIFMMILSVSICWGQSANQTTGSPGEIIRQAITNDVENATPKDQTENLIKQRVSDSEDGD